jgi:hypothetical protein
VEEFHPSGLTCNEFREKKQAEGISISKTRFHVWLVDYNSDRLSRDVTNEFRIPKIRVPFNVVDKAMDSFAASHELGHGKVEIFPSTIPHAGLGLRALVFIPACEALFDPCPDEAICRRIYHWIKDGPTGYLASVV